MTTIKVKLRPSKVVGKAGVIYYQITHNRKTQQITTRLRVHPSNWDANEEKLVQGAPNHSMIQNRINSDVALLRRVILDFDSCGMDYSVGDIINRYKSPHSHILVLDYMRSQVEQLRATNRLGTAKNYEKIMSSFSEFLGDVRLPMSALTEQVVTDYNSFLIQRGLVRNSVSFYMRVLRAVYNKAVRQKIIEQQHPFTEVYTGSTVHASVQPLNQLSHNCIVWNWREGHRLPCVEICLFSAIALAEWHSWILLTSRRQTYKLE